jgi:serine/threonine protein kinase/WD40 repeat protein
MAKSESRKALVLDLAEEIIVRLRSGERPRIEPYLARYPDLADPLRSLFASMAHLENLAFNPPAPEGPSEVPTPHPSSTIDDLNPELLENLLHEVDSDSGITFGSQKTQAAPGFKRPAPLSRLGDFRIIREIGHGGMGIVYEAEQVSLGRRVALKLLPPHMLRDERYRHRFEREARSAARLHHTNIVPVFGVGEHDGTPFYVMQYIEGLGLDGVLAEIKRLKRDSLEIAPTVNAEASISCPYENMARTLLTGGFEAIPPSDAKRPEAAASGSNGQPEKTEPPESPPETLHSEEKRRKDSFSLSSSTASLLAVPTSADSRRQSQRKPSYWLGVARIGAQVASALDYAHKQHILHRDIKPSNLLLDVHGTAWLSDFGLAKADDHQNLTHTGDVLGTVRYMPPEAFNRKADERGDIYSLGITLYEMLTLQPAFDQKDRAHLVAQVTTEEPKRLSKLDPEIPRDLETIVHKAIDRDPSHRYQTAADLAEDLQRFINDEPIRARPLSTDERLVRWCRHNPVVAALLATLATLLCMGVIVSTLTAVKFHSLAEERQKLVTLQAEAQRETELTLADMYTFSGIDAGMKGFTGRAVLWFANAALQSSKEPKREEVNRLRFDLWSRQTPQPLRAFRLNTGFPDSMVFDPGGQFLIVRGTKQDVHIWNLESSDPLPLPPELEKSSLLLLSPDGDWLASESGGTVSVFRFPELTPIRKIKLGGPLRGIAFSPDAPRLTIGDANRLLLWPFTESDSAALVHVHASPILHVGFNRRGDRLLSVTEASEASVFDAACTSPAALPLIGPVPAYGLTTGSGEIVPPIFVDNDRGLITITGPAELTWWDSTTGMIVRRWKESAGILRLVAGPAGNTFTVCGYRFAQLYNVATRQAVGKPMEHRNYVYDASYRSDEGAVLTVSSDRIARLWSVPKGLPISHPILHQREARRAAFSSDLHHFATAAEDGLVRVWTLPPDVQVERVIPLPSVEGMLRLSKDGRYVMAEGWNGRRRMRSIQVHDVLTAQPAAPPMVHQGLVNAAAFTPDGRHVLSLSSLPDAVDPPRPSASRLASQPGHVQLWDWHAGTPIGPPLETPSEPMGVDISPDGTRAAIACAGGQVILLDLPSMKVLNAGDHGAPVIINYLVIDYVRFAPDGKTFVTWGLGYDTCIWNTETGELRHRLVHPDRCNDARFTPDGQTLFTASADSTVRIWNVATGQLEPRQLAHSDWVFRIAVSPDGKSLLTAGREGMALLWDWRNGTKRTPPLEHPAEVFGVAFSRDGRWLYTSDKDGTVQSWDRATGKPVGPRWVVPGQAYDIELTPDDRNLVVSGDFGSLRIFPLTDFVTSPLSTTPASTLLTRGELLSGQRVLKGGGIVNLTTDEWLECWKRFTYDLNTTP